MKGKRSKGRHSVAILAAAAAGVVVGATSHSLRAADATWNTNASGNWTDNTKWSTGNVPGSTGSTNSPDAVTISSAVTGKTITLDSGRNINSLTFNAIAGPATLTGGSLVLTANGSANLVGAAASSAAVVSPITLSGDASFFGSSSTSNFLQIVGGVTGTATTGSNQVLMLRGSQGGNVGNGLWNLANSVMNDGANGGTLSVLKTDSGIWALNAGVAATTTIGGSGPSYSSGVSVLSFNALPTGVVIGDKVVGTGITTGTTVTGVDLSTNTITLSAATTAASSNAGVQFTGFSGGVVLNSGTLRINSSAAIGTGTLTINGGILSDNTTLVFNNTINWAGNFTYIDTNSIANLGAGSVTLGVASGVQRNVNVQNTTGTLTINGQINGGTGPGAANAVGKSGAGTLNLGNNGNTFSGLSVSGGTVTASTFADGTGSSYASPVNVGTPFGLGNITLDGGSLQVSVSKAGSGSIFYGALSNNVVLGNAGGTLVGLSDERRSPIFQGVISGTGKLTLNSLINSTSLTYPMVLQNTNSYTGGTDLRVAPSSQSSSSRHFVVADAVNALGGGAGGTGGVVNFVFAGTAAPPQVLLALKYNQSIAGLNNTSVRSAVTGYDPATTVTLTINNTAGGTGDNSNYGGWLGTAPAAFAGVTGTMDAGNSLSLVKSGTGTQILSGFNTYTGGTTINGGTLVISGGNTVAAVASRNLTSSTTAASAQITIDTSGLAVGQFVTGLGGTTPKQILAMNTATNVVTLNTSVASTGLTSAGFLSLASGSALTTTVTTAASTGSTSLTIASTAGLAVGQFITGSNSLAVGTQITAISGNVISLSQATQSNTISVGQSVTLPTTSGAGGGSVMVNSGGTLAGGGVIAGAVSVTSGGAISPGTGTVATLKTGNLTLAAGSQYRVDANLNSLVAHNPQSDVYSGDALQATGAVTLGGDLYFNFTGVVLDPSSPDTILLIDNDGGDTVTGTFAGVTTNYDGFATPAYTISYTFDSATGNLIGGNDVAITFTSVPEPGSAVLLALAAAGGLCHRRRRRIFHI